MSLSALAVRGPFHGPSGHDHQVREFVRELHKQGIAIQLTDLPSWSPAKLPAASMEPWFDSLEEPSGARTMLHFCMPHQVVPAQEMRNVNFTMFEATRICPLWVRENLKHDLVIVPTESSKTAWMRSGVPEELIRLCPLGVDSSVFSPEVPALPRDPQRVRFLNVSELSPRKNLFGLLSAWIRATSIRDDAVLVIKLGCYSPGLRELFAVQVKALELRLRKSLVDAAPVRFMYDILPDERMPRLYAAATHYISMSFGEGWDQPMMEAAASGLKLITPEHSAYTTYLDSSVASMIPSRQIPADYRGDAATAALFQGSDWWQPDEEQAIGYIREAIEGRDAHKPSPRDRIVAGYTWQKAARRLNEILSELEDRGGQQ